MSGNGGPMDIEELKLLARAQPNPFAGSVLRNGFELPINDVPEIHASQRQQLRALVEEVRRSGELALQVVTGEPGDGKTHLLASLRLETERSWREAGKECALVPIEPLRDPEAPFVHVLQELIRGLRRPLAELGSDGLSSALDHLLWKMLRCAVARGNADAQLAGDRYPSTDALTLRERWKEIEPALRDATPADADGEIWAVLCRFPLEPALVTRWLGGASMPEEDLARIGATQPLDTEQRAFRALSTFLHLSEVPLVLAFDQIEGVTRLGEGAVANFLQALGDQLYTAGGRGAVLVFCQLQAWKDFQQKLPQQTRDRFEQRRPLHLGAVDAALGERLLAQRLEAMWRGQGVTPPHATFPYPQGFVRKSIAAQNLRGPRQILSYFARLGFEAAEPAPETRRPPREVALSEYERLRREGAERTADETAAVAQGALLTILTRTRSVGDTTVIAARRAKHGIDAKFARQGREVTVYAEASNSRHGMAGKAVAKRLHEAKAGRALLLRGEKIELTPLLKKFVDESQGKAAVVRLGDEDARSFDAIERLLNSAAARDIDVSLEAAIAAVVEEIAPKLQIVRDFLDAAMQPKQPGGPAPRQSLVLAALTRPPFVVAESQLANQHGIPLEEVAAASDALEREGSVTVQRGKDGARTVLRRPK